MGKPKYVKPKKYRVVKQEWKLICNADHTDCKAVKIEEDKG